MYFANKHWFMDSLNSLLRSVRWFDTDVAGLPAFECLTFEGGIDR
jgi:hypothetical protein